MRFIAAALALAFMAGTANAAPKHPRPDSAVALRCVPDNDAHMTCRKAVQRILSHPRASSRRAGRFHLVTVSTAAGIDITVARSFAPAIRGFIADAVAAGYHPSRIHCWARGGHVRHSLHYSGRACDFNQHGWNKTDRFMYRARKIARKWGLRDGCSFHDCGHIDAGRQVKQRWASR